MTLKEGLKSYWDKMPQTTWPPGTEISLREFWRLGV